MIVNFLFNEKPVRADRFSAVVKASPDPSNPEMERNAIRVAALTRLKSTETDLPVIYAPEKVEV
jgi:hypothetical protein